MNIVKLKIIVVVNTSLFCGKAIEDKIIPITSGCYEQHVSIYNYLKLTI